LSDLTALITSWSDFKTWRLQDYDKHAQSAGFEGTRACTDRRRLRLGYESGSGGIMV